MRVISGVLLAASCVLLAGNAGAQEEYGVRFDDFEQRLRAVEQRQERLDAMPYQSGGGIDPTGELPTRIDDYDAIHQSIIDQLQDRIPSYQALPQNQIRDLEGEFYDASDMLGSFMFIHGYLRSGFGSNGKGGDQEVFLAPGAAAKYRLGNENDTYGEISFEKFGSPVKNGDGPIFRGLVMLAFVTDQNTSFDPDHDQFAVRQAYVEAGNFPSLPKTVSFWAGDRYYRRHDIHINDFYFLDMSGYGGGVEGIPVGCESRFAAAYIGGARDDFLVESGRIAKHNLDMRIYDVPSPGGYSIFWGNLAMTPAGNIQGGGHAEDSRGFALGYIHVCEDLLGGFNKCSVQWGRGAASNFTTNVEDPGAPNDASSQFLFTNTLTMQPWERFAMQTTTVTRVTDNGADPNGRIIWVSGGARPIVYLSEYWSVAFEYGCDWVDNQEDDVNGTLHKFTIAPQLSPSNNFFSRPAIRSFVTYAVWPESLKGTVGGPAYLTSTNGFSMGCQIEAWW